VTVTHQAAGKSRAVAAVPRLALTRQEAAHALGMGVTSFEQYVQPNIRAIRQGKLRLFPVSELQRWLEENAAMTLERLD
jgi:excisionase family DNA binding protein